MIQQMKPCGFCIRRSIKTGKIAIREYIRWVFGKYAVTGLDGEQAMRVSDLCTWLNALPDYIQERERTGKKTNTYFRVPGEVKTRRTTTGQGTERNAGQTGQRNGNGVSSSEKRGETTGVAEGVCIIRYFSKSQFIKITRIHILIFDKILKYG